MSSTQVLTGDTTWSSLSAPFQESEVITNKTDKDGHHYLKVLLLSNKKTRNNWIAPYKRIGDLSKEVIDSFIGLPHINEHSYPYFIQLKDKLERQGKSDDEILNTLKAESKKLGLDYIDHVFLDDPNSSLLYGQLKIMDKKENEFIEKNGRPSKNFTSPGVIGDATISDDGTEVYDMNTLRAFHLASVDIPAFPEQEAAVKGVCSNGNSESCRKVLAVAGFDSFSYPPTETSPLVAGTEPSENVNNPCSCNKNIEMSNNQPQVTVGIDTNAPPVATVNTDNTNTKLLEGAKNTTAEAIQAAREEAQKVFKENETKKAEAQKEKDEESNKPQLTEAERELKETKKVLETERNEKLEMKNFFLDKMISAAIPKENFQNEKEFAELTGSTKDLINKYGMTLVDADWLITKISKSIPAVPEAVVSTETKKEVKSKSVGVAGWTGMGNTMYNSDFITRPERKIVPKPQSGSSSGIEDEDYLQFLPS
jgi:hypothetical protein